MSNGAICRGTLAAPVDNEILHTSFAPILVPENKLTGSPEPDPIGSTFGAVPIRWRGPLADAIRAEYSADLLSARVVIPTFEEFVNSIRVNSSRRGAESLLSATANFVKREAPQHYAAYVNSRISNAVRVVRDDGKTLLKARGPLDAVSRAETKVRTRYGVFTDGFVTRRSRQRRSNRPLVPINSIGILFLERLRIRPLGHTVERAPFFQLSIEPNETVTLRQKSFSKRATSFESTVEESEERQLEYSSTFTTELAEEYANTTSNSDTIGLSHTGTYSYGTKTGGEISASHTGSYGASTTDSRTDSEAVRNAQTVSRRVAATQKVLHRTVVSVATEETLERESIRVLENRDTRTKKILMRRLMQVLHLSYERYGARLCWSPCIENPGRDVSSFVPGESAFANEVEAIRDKWDQEQPPPEELPAGPASTTVCTDWTDKLSGKPFGKSDDYSWEVVIPAGYVFSEASLEKRQIDGSPNVYIVTDRLPYPQPEATGVVTIWVHVGLGGGADPENIQYRVCVTADPGSELKNQRKASIRAWQQQQAEKEIKELIDKRRQEMAGANGNAWPISELMRRVINEYFCDPTKCDCDIVTELEHLFEWENLSYRLSAPWWKAETPVNGLQSLRTSFLNASWAHVFIPLRPGFEERAITWLMMVNAIPHVADELEYYLADLRENVLPQYARNYVPSQNDAKEIAAAKDILLTELDAQDWDNPYETNTGFKVLDRWTVTIPTDGVDFETAFARCDAATPMRSATEETARATAQAAEAISHNISNVGANVSVTIETP
jgi:hypothetical protein